MTWRGWFAGLLGAVAVTQAVAQPLPPLVPTRDAVVEYRVKGKPGSGERPVQVRFSGGKIRADVEGLPGPVIVDRAADRAMLLLGQQHLYFQVPIRSGVARDYLLNDRMSYTRGARDMVAGVQCTIWTIAAPEGRTATACITQDGLVLRGVGTDPRYGEGSLVATSVSYAPQPARLFAPPPDFRRIALPDLSGPADDRAVR